jgi:hypothetical protein
MDLRHALVLLVTASVAHTGCTGTSCTEEALSSVGITVVDAQGARVHDAVVTFTVEGGPSRTAECWTERDDGGCESYTAGLEEAGTFVITASVAGGPSASKTVVVQEDECHVIPESITIVLE